MADPSSFLVNVALSEMNLRTGTWRRVTRLATGVANNGQAAIIIPELFSQDTSAEVRPMAIEVVVASTPSIVNTQEADRRKRRQASPTPTAAPPTGLEVAFQRVVGAVKRWSSVIYYSLTTTLSGPCDRWCSDQRDGIGEELLARLPPCPRSVTQAQAPNSGFREDTGIARLLSLSFFHPGAATCFRQTTFAE